MRNGIRLVLGTALLATWLIGCSGGDPAPVQGDNPAASTAQNATSEQAAARGGMQQTTAPTGMGRAASGEDALTPPGK